MSLLETIVADLTAAMKAKETEKTAVLRMVKATLMNRKIEKGSDLTDEEVIKALGSLVKQRRDSIESYENASRPELAAKEAAEITFIDVYLPQAATADEIAAAADAAVAQTGAESIKDMGNVMKAAMANLAGKSADGRLVNEAVRSRLS
ncbi:MAG: GatB/YqeY domain-containing protein [Pyrinomonadaceae bacterium]